MNSNGLRLLTLCSEYDLTISNTIFRQKDKFKTSWQHPRSKHWHLIDYIIVRSRDQKDVNITRAITGADDCWTDHRLIRAKMNLYIPPRSSRQKKQIRRRFNVERLKDDHTKTKFQVSLNQKLRTTKRILTITGEC